MIGDLYYGPDENGKTDIPTAVKYYLKTEECALLGRRGAERVLEYHKSGGEVHLTKEDIRHLDLIIYAERENEILEE